MSDAVTLIFDIASFSSVMVLIVLGLGVIASMMGIFNFAHGEFVLLGAYTVYLSASAGLGLWFGIFAAPIVVGLVGLGDGAHHNQALLCLTDHRDAWDLRNWTGDPRDGSRLAGRSLQVNCAADRRRILNRRH